jgi:signal transduction histidine kinase/HAMP domain-containing protein
MDLIRLTIFDTTPFFDTPYQLIGWIGWFVMAALILWVIRNNLAGSGEKPFWRIFLILFATSITSAIFLGIDLPIKSVAAAPNVPSGNSVPTVMLFAMLPILITGGMLGVWPAALLGFLSGTISALWNTHSVFTPLETTAIAVMLALALRQDYRTPLFIFLRRPIGAALVVILLSIPVFLIGSFFSTNGALAAKLDYSITRSWFLVMVNGIQLLVAGLICEIFPITRSSYWVEHENLKPSPIEIGLQNRILMTSFPIVIILLLTLVIADWIVAGRAAREILSEQLEISSQIAAENIPAIIETGQSMLIALVEQDLPLNNQDKLEKILRAKVREIPFFSQIYLFDLTGAPITGYPASSLDDFGLSNEELSGIALALDSVQMQYYMIPPSPGGESALITFIAPIPDEYGLAQGVIVARTDFSINLFSQPTLIALNQITESGGEGAILNDADQVLYHTNTNLILSKFGGVIPSHTGYYEETGATGTRYMSYAIIDEATGWKVILSMPASYSQELALRIAVPLLIISIAISIVAFLLLRLITRTLTTSMVHLANKADEISNGELESKVEVTGVDEIGRLGSAFEQMRVSLKSRLDELDTLLKVSQGIAANLNLESSSAYLLKALLVNGADAVSLVLVRRITDDEVEYQSYRVGEHAEDYAYLDELLLEPVLEEPTLIISSKSRIRRMNMPKGVDVPSSLAAIQLQSTGNNISYIWVAYTHPHSFSEGEVRYLNTLAGQAVLAVSNAELYLTAEVGKKRLESVLSSTPEPVLVAGEDGGLLMVNQAAEQLYEILNLSHDSNITQGEIISKKLKDFVLGTSLVDIKSEEITLEDNKTYLVSVSPVDVEGQHVGRVCILSDVTEYKQLEKMKTEYVSTVSHDLKGPLSLIRGYTSMLPMVGEVNEQQREYTNKIIETVDDITRMADELLDMRRIDSNSLIDAEKIAPAEILNAVVEDMQPQILNRKIQIMPELTLSQDVMIEADRVLLQRALFNLLENAVKFSPLGGQVNLRLQVSEKSVTFVIQDHGPGIAPLDQPDIFDRVKPSLNKDGTVQRGSGLGLSIVKSIAARHQGRVWVESQLGKGCTFYLEIPIRYIDKKK